jgi:undecaprenyl-diphosphatase
MPLVHAIVLGIVQGLSEFLPISSSGHLLVVPWLFGWSDLDDVSVKKAFDVALHIGTLAAVVAYFRRDLIAVVRDGLVSLRRPRGPHTPSGRLAWLLVLSAVPAAAAGALFDDVIERRLGTPGIIAASLVLFGAVLAVADRRVAHGLLASIGVREALIIGTAQVLALNPGTSRSGITISAALLLGIRRDDAARFAFLMSLPVTVGAVVFKVGGLVRDGVPDGLLAPMLVGIAAAAVSGWVAVWGTLRLVRTRTFTPFVLYRVALASVILVVLAAGWR